MSKREPHDLLVLPDRGQPHKGFLAPPWPHRNDKTAMAGSFCTGCPDERCEDCPLSLCPTCGTELKAKTEVPSPRWRTRLLPATRKRISK